MSFKTPPLKAAFFEASVELPRSNPNLPATMLEMVFRRVTQPWANWCTSMARAVGFPLQSLTAVATLNFGNLVAGASADLTATVTGVKANDVKPVVNIGLPTGLTAGLVFQGWVSADDTVTVRCTNASTGAIDPAEADFRIEVRRY
jgi:hypothetical protein